MYNFEDEANLQEGDVMPLRKFEDIMGDIRKDLKKKQNPNG